MMLLAAMPKDDTKRKYVQMNVYQTLDYPLHQLALPQKKNGLAALQRAASPKNGPSTAYRTRMVPFIIDA